MEISADIGVDVSTSATGSYTDIQTAVSRSSNAKDIMNERQPFGCCFLVVFRVKASRLIEGSALENISDTDRNASVEFVKIEAVGIVRCINSRRNGTSRRSVGEGANALDVARIDLTRARVIRDQLARGLIENSDDASSDPDLIVVSADRGKIVAALHIIATVARDLRK